MSSEGVDEEEEEQPDIDEDDYATVDPELAAKAAEEADGGDDEDEEDQSDEETSDDSVPATEPESRKSVGDVYVRAMGAAAYAARDRAGDGVEKDRSAVIDEYADLAADLELDDYMDQWYQENIGGSDEMSPGQGLVAMSGLFFAMVMLDDPAMVDGALDGVMDS
jgi:hypothetical protein